MKRLEHAVIMLARLGWPRLPSAFARRLLEDRKGNVMLIVALALPVLIGMAGLAIEGSSWYRTKQRMQNAADAAATAAATNGTSAYALEAKAVAEQFGFKDGVNNVTVTATNNAACPSGGSNCYRVTIQKREPLVFVQMVGFRGSGRINGTGPFAQALVSQALAQGGSSPREYCILALAGSGASPALLTNGAPFANLTGCNVMSNTNATCNGHNLQAAVGDAVGINNGCGITQNSNVPSVSDPYATLASNIPANTCSAYPKKPSKNKDPALPNSNKLSGSYSTTGNWIFCGDVQLSGNVTLTGSSVVIVIMNGQFDTNGYTILTASGAAATIVFSGTNTAGYTSAPTGGGTIDIAAPTSGAWSGVAIYQDPALTTGVDVSAAGNSPTWNITGLVYLPNASVTFSGAVNKATNGQACFGMVVDSLRVNGTGSILTTGGCAAAGLELPQNSVSDRGQLVS